MQNHEEMMTREKLLSVTDIAGQLNTGKATTKFLLKRFKHLLPSEHIHGQAFYSPDIVRLLFIVQANLEMGMMPEDIEKKLAAMTAPGSKDPVDSLVPPFQTGDSRLDPHRLTLMESLFHDIAQQQKKIAEAQERRAVAEEKKVDALTALVHEFQAFNKRSSRHPEMADLLEKAGSLVDDQKHSRDIPLDDLSQLIDKTETLQHTPDDRSQRIADPGVLDDRLDDLSQLIDDTHTPDDQLDDLSLLVDETNAAETMNKTQPELDDLSALIEQEPPVDDPAIQINGSPEQDLEKYKADILRVIIDLKAKGLNIEDTTQRLNTDRIKTLSGKKQWSSRAISQIYTFIESAT